MNDKARMILYALTATACAAWEAQSIHDYIEDGTLSSAPSIIFLICVGVATLYCGVNAFILWQRDRRSHHDDASKNAAPESSADQASKNNSTI